MMLSQDFSTRLLAELANEPWDTFTAELARQSLGTLDSELLKNKNELCNTIRQSQVELTSQLQLTRKVLCEVDDIASQLTACINQIHNPSSGLIHCIKDSLSCHSTLAQEFYDINTAYSGLFHLYTCTADYNTAQALVQQGDIVQAHQICVCLLQKVTCEAPHTLLNSDSYQELKKNIRVIDDNVLEQLSLAYEAAVNVSKNGDDYLLTIRRQISATSFVFSLASLLEATPEDAMELYMKSFRKKLVTCFIEPLISSNYTIVIEEGREVNRLTLQRSKKKQTPLPDLRKLLEFLSNHLFSALPKLHRVTLPSSLYTPITSTLLEHCLEPNLPNSLASIPSFLATADEFVLFEASMLETGSSNRDDIRKWVAGLDLHYERKRVEFYVEEARNLVRESTGRGTTRINEMSTSGSMRKSSISQDQAETEDDSWGFTKDEGNGIAQDRNKCAGDKEAMIQDDADGWDWDDGEQDTGSPVRLLHTSNDMASLPADHRTFTDQLDSLPAEDGVLRPTSSTGDKATVNHGQQPEKPTLKILALDQGAYDVSISAIALGKAVESAALEGRALRASSVFSHLQRVGEHKSGALLLRTAPALLDLVQAMYPLQDRRESRTLLLRANDLFYIAGVARSLQREGEGAVRTEAGDKLHWEETISGLASTARECLKEAVDQEILAMAQALTLTSHFVNITDDSRYEAAEQAARTVLKALRAAAYEWKSIITLENYYNCLGKVVDATLCGVMSPILKMEDITESESRRLADICRVLEPVQTLFVDSGGNSQVATHVSSWFRFSYLAELLVASIADISYLFDEGMLVDYEVSEIVRLLRALFAESYLREKTIRRIEQGHPAIPK